MWNMIEENKKTLIKVKANNIYMIYKNYYDDAFNQIENVLISVFGFVVRNDNGVLNFEIGGNGYNCYLSRGYIVLEAEDNSTIENVYTADTVDDFIELINDLLEDK